MITLAITLLEILHNFHKPSKLTIIVATLLVKVALHLLSNTILINEKVWKTYGCPHSRSYRGWLWGIRGQILIDKNLK